MKKILLAMAFGCMGLAATAQSSLLTASPIPEGAESRFCYYAGLAYSRSAYIQIGGNTKVAQVTGGSVAATSGNTGALNTGAQVRSSNETKLMECAADSDGTLRWKSVATVQIGK